MQERDGRGERGTEAFAERAGYDFGLTGFEEPDPLPFTSSVLILAAAHAPAVLNPTMDQVPWLA